MNARSPTAAFPLAWPYGQPRTPTGRRKEARFRSPLGTTIPMIRTELATLEATNIVISTNLPTRNDGFPYATGRLQTDDPGAAVYWFQPSTRKGYVLACDCWTGVAENLRAIALSLEAMRGLGRWGVSEVQERTFAGFQALADPAGPPPHFAGITDRPTLDTRYRELARTHHPDNGGGHEAFIELERQYVAVARRLSPCRRCGNGGGSAGCPACRGRGYVP